MNRREVVAEFYEILQGLRAKQGGFKLLATCHGKMGWPARGAYFFLEGGEFRSDGSTPRVVRIGTHAVSANSQTTLRTRLSQHRGSLKGSYSGGGSAASFIRDRDTAFGRVYVRRVRMMGIRDRPIAPRSPWQNGHVERLIGSVRRECLDHLVISGEAHLGRILKTYTAYYNEIDLTWPWIKKARSCRRSQTVGAIVTIPVLGGLHHQYVRV